MKSLRNHQGKRCLEMEIEVPIILGSFLISRINKWSFKQIHYYKSSLHRPIYPRIIRYFIRKWSIRKLGLQRPKYKKV